MLLRHINVDVVLACILLLFNEADTLTFVDIQVTLCHMSCCVNADFGRCFSEAGCVKRSTGHTHTHTPT